MGELSTKYAGGMAAALKLAPEVVEETCKGIQGNLAS